MGMGVTGMNLVENVQKNSVCAQVYRKMPTRGLLNRNSSKKGEHTINKISTPTLLLSAMAVIVIMVGHYLLTVTRHGVVSGLVHSEDRPCAIIGREIVHEGNVIYGVKVVKIYADRVEFEKNWMRWTQQVDERPNLAWPGMSLY